MGRNYRIQTGNDGYNRAALDDVQYILTEVGGGLTFSDLFNADAVTGYQGGIPSEMQIIGISKAANATVTTAYDHGMANGRQDHFCLDANAGMGPLDGVTVAVSNVTANTFQIGIDKTSYPTFDPNQGSCYSEDIGLWATIALSKSLHASNPGGYPDNYTYFNEQQKRAILGTGVSSSGVLYSGGFLGTPTTNFSVRKAWDEAKVLADSKGVKLWQYETNGHFTTGTLLGRPSNPQGAIVVGAITLWPWSKEWYDCALAGYRALSGDRRRAAVPFRPRAVSALSDSRWDSRLR